MVGGLADILLCQTTLELRLKLASSDVMDVNRIN